MKKILSFLVLLAMLCSMSVSSFASGTVTYDGTSQKFIFEPGSSYSPTDLFDDFKNVMPGDSITQQLHIINDVSNDVKIELFVRSLGAAEGSEDFLSQLELRVEQEGNSILFDAPADQTAQLTEWVYLGTFYSGADILLNITLDVPIDLGNEYQEAMGYIHWEFKVNELPIEPDDPKPPQTGDNTGLIIGTMIISLAAIFFLILFLRRRKQDNT